MKSTSFCYLLITLSFFCISGSLINKNIHAQTQFALAIGGTNNDIAYSIIQTQDGGYVLGGISTPIGTFNHKMFAVKINSSGSIQWSRIVDSLWATSITQAANGRIALSSLTYNAFAEGTGICLIELDDSGALQWNGWFPSDGNSPTDIKITSEGGYLLSGSSAKLSPHIYIAKLNASKNFRWEKVISVGNVDYVNSITETADGGCAGGGGTTPAFLAPYDMYIVKLDSSGNLLWNRSIGGASNDNAISIARTAEGGYALAGYTLSFGAGNSDMYVVKLDASGNLQWSRTIGGTGNDYAECIIQTSDGGFAVGGYTQSFGAGNYDMYIVKLNASGTLQWSRTAGGTGSDLAKSIIQTMDGGYAISGSTQSFGAGNGDMFFVKLDASGNSCGYSTSPTSIVTNPTTLITTPNSYIVSTISGVSNPSAISNTGGTATNLCLVGIEPGSNETSQEFTLYQNYPNPFNPLTKISFDLPKPSFVNLVVYDVNGKEAANLVNEDLSAGKYSYDFDGTNLSSGIYFYRIIADGFNEVRKMMLVK